ncbi:amidohydrolase [Pararhodobacter sp.]|uniref:amidohydrolase n=1 Tax=Pararhodobacter sp. TaxID=2127056 RepID=UPI002FDD254C
MTLHADIVIENARPVSRGLRGGQIASIAIRDGRILSLGAPSALAHLIGPDTRRIDAQQNTVIPGIIDSHCHADRHAVRLQRWIGVSPPQAPDRAALLSRLRQAVMQEQGAPGGGKPGWVAACRFDDQRSGGYPDLSELDAVSRDIPIIVMRTDNHLAVVNTAAFERLGLHPDVADPPFGRFDRADNGRLTGLVREAAMQLFVNEAQADDRIEDFETGLEMVYAEWVRYGITSIQNSLTGRKPMRAMQNLRARDALRIRTGIIASGREPGLVESLISGGIQSGLGDDWLRLIGVEWCPDCSTSGRTAAYYDPYVGTPVPGEPVPNTGMLLYDASDLKERAAAAHAAGLQVMIEGVGDRGIDFALDAIEHALSVAPRTDHRMRVEHCCYVTPAIEARLKALGVICSSATGFMYELGGAYRRNRGGDAMARMWPHRAMIDAGIPAPGHSDAMIVGPNPFEAIWSMVNRQSLSGDDLDAAQAVSVAEAIDAYTWLGAYAGREEGAKGSLEPGKLADIAVLDRDIEACDPLVLRDVSVQQTLIGGAVVHAA